jgi:DNA replication protein DnaC
VGHYKLAFVKRRESVIFLGPPGVCKTHLAISLAIAAAKSGRRAYCGTLVNLIESLNRLVPQINLPAGFEC